MRCAAFGALGALGEHAKEHAGAIGPRPEDDFFFTVRRAAVSALAAGGSGRAREGVREGCGSEGAAGFV